jgi:integrase
MARARKQSAEKKKTPRRWGKFTPTMKKVRRPDGTTLEFWSLQYPIEVWTLLPDGQWETKKVYRQKRGDSPKHCEDLVEALLEENDRYLDWLVANKYPPVTINDWRRNYDASVPVSIDGPLKVVTPVVLTDDAPVIAPVLLDVVATEFMEPKLRQDGNGNSVELSPSYMKKVQVYIRSLGALATKPMNQLSRQDVDQWFRTYQLAHKQNTVSRYRAWLLPLGEYAVTCSYWKANLFAILPKVSAQRQTDKPTLTFQEIDKIWNGAGTDANLAALFVLLRFGLRIGEALGLTAECLNDDGSIQVKYNLSETPNDGEYIQSKNKMLPYLGSTKTRASASKVRIPKQWMPLLRLSLAQAKPMLIKAFDDQKGPREHLFVVSNNRGICWRDESAKRGVNKLLEKVGVDISSKGHSLAHEPVNHIWRYTYCSELVALGANDIELQSLMRHTDANTSKQIYAQIRLEDKKLFDHYRKQVSTLYDYNQAIADMDEDRRAGINPLVVKKPSTPPASPLTFSIPTGTALPSLPKPKKGLGGFIGTDGSVKVDI